MTENMGNFPFLGRREAQIKIVLSPVLANVKKVVSTDCCRVKQNSGQDDTRPRLKVCSGNCRGYEEGHQAVLVQLGGQSWPGSDLLETSQDRKNKVTHGCKK